jgi:hypothetical protein
MYQYQEEHLLIDFPSILMHILYIMLSDHSDHARFLHHTLNKMVMDFICLNHQEFTLDIHAVQLVKEDKLLKLNSKKPTSLN